jgi:hypothetical protein
MLFWADRRAAFGVVLARRSGRRARVRTVNPVDVGFVVADRSPPSAWLPDSPPAVGQRRDCAWGAFPVQAEQVLFDG